MLTSYMNDKYMVNVPLRRLYIIYKAKNLTAK